LIFGLEFHFQMLVNIGLRLSKSR